MAVSVTVLTNSGNDDNQNSYTTASISPPGNKPVFAVVVNTKNSAPETPALSGNGLTWVVQQSVVWSSTWRITLYRALGATPSSGAVSITFGGVGQTGCSWVIGYFDGAATGGTNASEAFVQSASNTGNNVSSLTVTLSAFGSATNAAFGAFAVDNSTSPVVGSGFTSVATNPGNSPGRSMLVEFKTTSDTTVDSNSEGANRIWGAVACEIKEAVTGSTLDVDFSFIAAWLRQQIFSRVIPASWRRQTQHDYRSHSSWLSSLSMSHETLAAWQAQLMQDQVLGVSAFQERQRDADILPAWMANVRQDVTSPTDWLAEYTQGQTVLVSWQKGVSHDSPLQTAWRQQLSQDATLPVSWQGTVATEVLADTSLLVAWQRQQNADSEFPVSYRRNVVSGHLLIPAWLQQRRTGSPLQTAWLQQMRRDSRLSVTAQAVNIYGHTMLPQWIQSQVVDRRIVAAFQQGVTAENHVLPTWRMVRVVDASILVSWLSEVAPQIVESDHQFLVAWGGLFLPAAQTIIVPADTAIFTVPGTSLFIVVPQDDIFIDVDE